MDQVALKMVDISKSFSGVKVLRDVSFGVHKGEVHSLLGHNGAGKSVLMKTLMGVHQPDSGKYIVNGKEVRFANPAEAQQNGVSMVYQEFGLVKTLSVAENVFMGRWPRRRGVINWNTTRKACEEVLARIGSTIPSRTIVGNLKVAEQQEVEIARALSYDPAVFIILLVQDNLDA